jgi:hypothetical protein
MQPENMYILLLDSSEAPLETITIEFQMQSPADTDMADVISRIS